LNPADIAATVAALEEREERWTDEVLEGAKERLSFGWTQGTLAKTLDGERQGDPDEDSAAFCLLGALASAAAALGADVSTLRRAERLAADAISSGISVGESTKVVRHSRAPRRFLIATWNDQPGRSKAEVIAVVERALEQRRC
jgi:hypothetical protein